MGNQAEFIKEVEIALNKRIGSIISGSILKNNLTKMNKPVASMTREDCKALIESIAQSVALFESKGGANLVKADLEKILQTMK